MEEDDLKVERNGAAALVDVVSLGLLVLAGVCCAPTITATVDGLSRVVPERVRGEAMGLQRSTATMKARKATAASPGCRSSTTWD